VSEAYTAHVQAAGDDATRFHFARGRRKPPPADATPADIATGEEPLPNDARAQRLAASDKANRLAVFDFDPDAPWRGHGTARLTEVVLDNAQGARLTHVQGGERVRLRVVAKALAALERPIVGFFVKDPSGQELFGDNTFLSYADTPVPVAAGDALEAVFTFTLPYFREGDHSLTVAVADGTQDDHQVCCWMEDALFIRPAATHVSRGLIGVPMEAIGLRRLS